MATAGRSIEQGETTRAASSSRCVQAGWPGLRFCNERLESYDGRHLPTDDLAHVNFDQVARVARLTHISGSAAP